MEGKHSKGKWKIVSFKSDYGNLQIETVNTVICRTVNKKASAKPEEEEKANARIISLSPQMAEALIRISTFLESENGQIAISAGSDLGKTILQLTKKIIS